MNITFITHINNPHPEYPKYYCKYLSSKWNLMSFHKFSFWMKNKFAVQITSISLIIFLKKRNRNSLYNGCITQQQSILYFVCWKYLILFQSFLNIQEKVFSWLLRYDRQFSSIAFFVNLQLRWEPLKLPLPLFHGWLSCILLKVIIVSCTAKSAYSSSCKTDFHCELSWFDLGRDRI